MVMAWENTWYYFSILWKCHQAVAQLREGAVASGCLEFLLLKGTFWLWQLPMTSEEPSASDFHSFLLS